MPVLILGSPDAVRGLLLDRGKNFTSERGWGSNIGELFARGRDFRVPAATGASYRSRSGLKPRAATSTR